MDYTFSFWLGIVVIFTTGNLAHFLYDLSHANRIIALFAAVNESTWEHIKIALTPTILWGLYDGYLYGSSPNYFSAKLFSLLTIVFVIPFIFYSYQRITKKPCLPVDILTFLAAIVISQLTFYAILTADTLPYILCYLSCAGLFVFFGSYMTLTLAPLRSPIFRDPLTGQYGLRAHRDFFRKIKQRSTKKPSRS